MRQGWLWTGLLLYRKKVAIGYFENIQQDLINDVPAYLCWDAKYFYKVKINDIDVTFDKAPLLTSERYSGKFTLIAYGLFSKTKKTISLRVKSYEQTKKIKEVKPKFKLQRAEKFLEIQNSLLKIPRPKIRTKKYSLKISDSKLQKLSLRTDKIIDSNFIENLKQQSIYHNYQQEFLTEFKKQHGK